MINITKAPEPRWLVNHRLSASATYANLSSADKDLLRCALVTEQRGLCCYCMSRIRPDQMKIAHWRSQATYPAQQLAYDNLLGACLGNEGQPQSLQHCDTRQGSDDLSRNPANAKRPVEGLISYASDGSINSSDTQFNQDLDTILNLNVAFLKNNRKAALDGLLQALPKKGAWPSELLWKHLQKWSGAGGTQNLEPFCGVVIYWLKRRLARP